MVGERLAGKLFHRHPKGRLGDAARSSEENAGPRNLTVGLVKLLGHHGFGVDIGKLHHFQHFARGQNRVHIPDAAGGKLGPRRLVFFREAGTMETTYKSSFLMPESLEKWFFHGGPHHHLGGFAAGRWGMISG
jgi:hypothetical protein